MFVCLFVWFWRDSAQWARASSFTRFLDHAQRRPTVLYDSSERVISSSQRPPPDNTQNTHNRQMSMPPVGFELTVSAGDRPQTYALDRTAISDVTNVKLQHVYRGK